MLSYSKFYPLSEPTCSLPLPLSSLKKPERKKSIPYSSNQVNLLINQPVPLCLSRSFIAFPFFPSFLYHPLLFFSSLLLFSPLSKLLHYSKNKIYLSKTLYSNQVGITYLFPFLPFLLHTSYPTRSHTQI